MATDPRAASPAPSTSTDNVAHSAGRAGAATLTSRILGLVREQVLAAYFGASHDYDAYVVAFRIPNLVRDLFAEGAMSAAFVPAFTRQLALRGRADAWRLGNSVINGLIVVTGVLVLLAIVFAEPLVRLFAGDFAEVPGKLELTVQLTRVMLPFLTLAALAAAVMGMLNSLHRYFLPALSPATFNVITIILIVAAAPLMPSFGWPTIMVVAIATIVGGIAQVAIQWPLLRREGFRYAPVLDRSDPALRQVLLLMGPGTIGLAATQINLLITTQLATAQPGAPSWLQYAFRVMYLPIGLFGVSIATAVLPAISRAISLDDVPAVRRTVAHGIVLMLVVNIPATVGLLVVAPEAVRLLFERGQFHASDTAATALAVQGYAIGLVGYSAARIVSPVFYALGRSRIAVALSATSVAVNLVLSLTLFGRIGFSGLALATATAAIVNGALSLLLLRREVGSLEGRRIVTTALKMAVVSIVMAAVTKGALVMLDGLWPGDGVWQQGLRLLLAIAAGLGVLALQLPWLGIQEADEALAQLRRRIASGRA